VSNLPSVKVLLTGFAPFAGHDLNPSWEALSALSGSLGNLETRTLLLPVSFANAFVELEKAIEEFAPDLVICVGLAEKRDQISLERVAINLADARIPDNDGNQPADLPIDYSAPNAYFCNMPIKKIIQSLEMAAIPARISETAGTFVCNQVMFKLLHLIAVKRPALMGGFVHVPCTPQMLDSSSGLSGLPLEKISLALQIIVESCAEHIITGKWRGTRRKIVPYNPSWPDEYARIESVLKNGLKDLALRIDHIGSTAVPGLCAKDVIDVQITVASLSEEVAAALTGLGYFRVGHIAGDHAPPGTELSPEHWQKWFFRPPKGQRATNTHVRVAGRANQRYPLLFRDYLRAHPQTAAAYGQLKMRLADNLANAAMYPDVKDPAVDLIYFPAEKWAEETGWQGNQV
jgi:pyroglutamyl-peptidase I